METVTSILLQTWEMFFLSAPFIVLGLLVGGLLHVLISRRVVERWMGGGGMAAVTTAAAIGIPLPLCSCGVVPVSIALSKKGASRPAILSFLISTPESDPDAIFLTWGMFGPVMAIARLVASFLTSLIAGVVAIAIPERRTTEATAVVEGAALPHADDWRADDAHVVGFEGLWRSIRASARERVRFRSVPPGAGDAQRDVVPLPLITRRVLRYAFVDLADAIAFWLVIGLLIAGVIAVLVPNDLAARGLGAGLLPMLLMMAVGIPMYVCASASTPIAAALVAKGLSPGAALVFLLTGPATNAATIVLLTQSFGAQFVRIYVLSIAIVALACGVLLDWMVVAFGWRITATLGAQPGGVAGVLQVLSVVLLLVVIVWRLAAGALRQGVRDLVANFDGLVGIASGITGEPESESESELPLLTKEGVRGRSIAWRRRLHIGGALALAAYVLSGFTVVPADARGYGFLFGRLAWPDLAPGLHYVPPAPIGRCDVFRTGYPRKTDIGFRTDLRLIAARRALAQRAIGGEWHSPVAAMNAQPQEASYIAGDENLLELSFTVHYRLSDPYAFFYRVDKDRDLVSLYAQTSARQVVAQTALDELLTVGRQQAESFIASDVQRRLDAVGAGVRIESVHVVDIHPPQDAVFAFRDVSSAREERETRVHVAYATLAREIPRARGRAAVDVATAQAAADAARTLAGGRAQSFMAQAEASAANPPVIRDLLWLETAERILSQREKFVVPSGTAGGGLVLWRDQPTAAAAGEK